MNDIIDQFKGLLVSKTAKDTYIVFSGNIVSFLFGIIFAVLAARAIEPSGWGTFSAGGALLVILFSFSELGLSSGLFRFASGLWTEGKKNLVSEVASVILAMRMIISIFFCILIVIFARALSLLVFRIDSIQFIYIIALGLVGALLVDFQISLLQVKRRWMEASILTSATNFFRLLLLLVHLYFRSFNLASLFLVFFLSPFGTFFVSLLFEVPSFIFSQHSLSLLKKVSKFSIWMGINGSVGSVSSKVDSILLIQIAGAFEAGIVGAARQLSNAVLILVSSFATVIATRLASYKGIHLRKYFRKTVLLSFVLACGVLAGIIFVGPVISLLGPKYSLSAGVLRWLMVGLIPFALATPFVNSIIYAFHKPNVIALLSVIQLPLIILGNIILIPKFGIYGPVIIIGVWNLTTLIITTFKAKWELSHTV